MKTIRFIIALCALGAVSTVDADAQRFLDRVHRAAEEAAERAVIRQAEKRTEDAVNDAIDDAFERNENQQQQPNQQNQQQGNAPAGSADASGNPQTPAGQAPQQPQSLEMTYSKSDFVAGDEIIFEDLLIGEKLGEFPSMWDLESGNAEIATINGENAISLIGYTIIRPLMEEKEYLPDVFTIEFDILSNGNGSSEMGFGPGRTLIPRHYLRKDGISFHFSWTRPDGQGGSQSHNVKTSGHQWNHISISFNQRALKYYINGERILNVPNMKAPKDFWVWANEGGTYIRNVRLAKGAVPLYDRMMTDGKFITYGITFDVGKSTIKPESMGEINRIVTLMTENPDLKFSVEGHTDNTGNAAANQTLSEQRSAAIVAKLTELGIAADRLTASGKGQNTPIADNGTDEGRAKNRRVEFVKQ